MNMIFRSALLAALCIVAMPGCKKQSTVEPGFKAPNPVPKHDWGKFVNKMGGDRLWHVTKYVYPTNIYPYEITESYDTAFAISIVDESTVNVPVMGNAYLAGADSALLVFNNSVYDNGPEYVRGDVLYFPLIDSISMAFEENHPYGTKYTFNTK